MRLGDRRTLGGRHCRGLGLLVGRLGVGRRSGTVYDDSGGWIGG
jgi:hypothetical protein